MSEVELDISNLGMLSTPYFATSEWREGKMELMKDTKCQDLPCRGAYQ